MQGREIRAALRAGQRVYSSAVVAASPMWPGVFQQAGASFAFIDSEHTPLNRETLAWMCHAFRAADVPPVVRIPAAEATLAAMVLDGGASGFIAPYLETVEQARELTAVARYRPLKGKRAQQALDDPNSLEPELAEYLKSKNADTIFIANIESTPAIDNLDAILEASDIDALLIGPHDLSCSLGIPEQYDDPRFDEAVEKIFSIGRRHRVGVGIHFWGDIEREIDWIKRFKGNLVVHAADVSLFGAALKTDFDTIRAAIE
ncbi:MAG: 2-keto-3-deoxy-L-rhamnonate aldolase RhmA [Pirellulaceae bacterium]|jgi:2-keto-3-deoxy-L-rhamnonate aldolase RhmA